MLTSIPPTIDVLGYDEHHRVLIWSSINQELYVFDSFSEISRHELIRMAGFESILQIEENLPDDMSSTLYIKDGIAEMSRRRKISTHDTLGIGVWKHPIQPGLLLVTGNRFLSVATEGRRIKCQIDSRPLLGASLIEYGDDWFDLDSIKAAMSSFSLTKIRSRWDELLSHLGCWSFQDPHDHQMVAGLAVATTLQSVWPFRPQVSITGRTNSGKTALRTIMKRFWPFIRSMDGRASKARLEQSIGHKSIPYMLDEQESWRGRQTMLELLRSSTRGGESGAGSPSGRPITFKIAHIVWLFAIEDGIRDEADNNRFARFTIEPSKSIAIPPEEVLAPIGLDLMCAAMVCASEIADIQTRLTEEPAFKRFGRLVEVYALPVAVWASLTGHSFDDAVTFLEEVLLIKHAHVVARVESDEVDLLADILHSTPRGGTKPIIRLLTEAWDNDADLQNVGVRMGKDARSRFVFFAHRVLHRAISLGARWYDKDIRELLMRLPGAEADKQRVNKKPESGVWVPMDLITPSEEDEGEEDLPPPL